MPPKVRAEQNEEGKWKWIEIDENGTVINESDYIYDTKGRAKVACMRQREN